MEAIHRAALDLLADTGMITPFTLAGAMVPVSLAGALTQQHAEALAAITLAQLVKSGAPVVYGAFTSNVDMRSGAPAFGTPEAFKAALASGQLARHIDLPWRSSGVSTSNTPDAQGGYETMMNMFGALLGGANMIVHAAGWLESGSSASYEKFILDVDMLHMIAETYQPIDTAPAEIGLEAIAAAALAVISTGRNTLSNDSATLSTSPSSSTGRTSSKGSRRVPRRNASGQLRLEAGPG